jgi:saccharopine dehydrogenase (NADP+, L-glutamate forming)
MKPFIPALLTADFTAPFEDLALPRQLKRAVIVHQGKLAPDFAYLAESLPKRVLVLGAGLMSPAVIDYLLGSGYEVIVSDAQLDHAQKRIEPHAYASVKAIHLPIGVENYGHLVHAAQKVDVVVSLLPAGLHPIAAAACIEARTHLVTASYISEAMRALDPFAKQAGVILLNEVGLDPGMDHMSAMRVIHDVHGKFGRITAFTSYCGGLPEPSVANNPLRFKASWSPAGIVSAANRPARVKQDGAVRDYAPRQLFEAPLLMDFEGIPHRLEAYPNGDSTAYIDLYELPEAETFIRGTLRYEGWSEIISALHDLGWFTDALAADVVAKTQAADLAEPVRAVVDWLGLTQAPETPTDAYSYLFAQFKAQPDLAFGPNERDLVLMRHSFTVEYPDGKRELITSSLVVTGEANGISAMAATVGYTSAICARVIIEGLFRSTGVQMPLSPKLYNVVLDELASLPFGLGFDEAYHPLA